MRDLLILGIFCLVCTLMYIGLGLLFRCNRCAEGRRTLLLSGAAALLGTTAVWYTAFASPFARNWGLGGSYLWMAVCPALYLFCGIAATVRSTTRKESDHD